MVSKPRTADNEDPVQGVSPLSKMMSTAFLDVSCCLFVLLSSNRFSSNPSIVRRCVPDLSKVNYSDVVKHLFALTSPIVYFPMMLTTFGVTLISSVIRNALDDYLALKLELRPKNKILHGLIQGSAITYTV